MKKQDAQARRLKEGLLAKKYRALISLFGTELRLQGKPEREIVKIEKYLRQIVIKKENAKR